MKKNLIRFSAWVVLLAMTLVFVPGIINRVSNESKNQNIVVSILYSNIAPRLSPNELDKMLNEYKEIGVDTITLLETDMNQLVLNGLANCTKFNALSLKYDDFSKKAVNKIRKAYPNVSNDSYILTIEDSKTRKKVSYDMAQKYTSEDYYFVGTVDKTDIYIIHNGRANMWDIVLGYDEDLIKELKSRGHKICLLHKVTNYKKTKYLDDIENVVEKYDVEYLNLKSGIEPLKGEKFVKENYTRLADIINKYNLTYVVTENSNHLQNQDFPGYDYVFDKVMGKNGSKKVIRSYETYDNSQDDGSHYKHRVSQFFNSTIDRNIRFVTVTQIDVAGLSYQLGADYTLKATKQYIEKIQKCGYTVNKPTATLDYSSAARTNAAAAAVFMIMCVLIIINIVSGKTSKSINIIGYVLAIISVVATIFMPKVLLGLYPTAYSLVMSCFAITLAMGFLKAKLNTYSFPILFLGTTLITVGSLLITSLGQSAMLSGIDYYINNDVFRGIKLSLMVPIVYTAVVAYYMFVRDENFNILPVIKKVLVSEIKVYWLIIGALFAVIISYYIKRSGNVNSISEFEKIMRDTITDIFPARPRTKEFLVGYPSLMLFVYYAKKYNIKLLKWSFAVGASILTASVANSFCHVFTNYSTICMRVVNGIIIGAILCIPIYFANIVIVRLIKLIKEKF